MKYNLTTESYVAYAQKDVLSGQPTEIDAEINDRLAAVQTIASYTLPMAFNEALFESTTLNFGNLTSIGDFGMIECFTMANLTKIDIPNLKTVGENGLFNAFGKTPDLSSVCIGAGGEYDSTVTNVGYRAFERAFQNAPTLSYFALVGSFADCTIGSSAFAFAFSNCTKLSTVNIINLGSINDHAFYRAFSGCTNLSRARITQYGYQKAPTIGDRAFDNAFVGCENLKFFDLSSTCRVGANAFSNAFTGCISLNSVGMSYMNQIGSRAFYRAFAETGLTSFSHYGYCRVPSDFSTAVTKTAPYMSSGAFYQAFASCSRLSTVQFVQGWSSGVSVPRLTAIEPYTFYSAFTDCTALESALFGWSGSIGASAFMYAFSGCTNLSYLHFGQSTIGACGLRYAGQKLPNLKSLNMSAARTIYSSGMFGAFAGCSNLSSINLDFSALTVYTDGLYYAFASTAIKSVAIPTINFAGTSSYGTFGYTFLSCTSLTSVSFPVRTISDYGMQLCFYGCTNLPEARMQNLNTVYAFGARQAFMNCSSLSVVEAPELCQVGSSGFYAAFANCTSLTSIELSRLSYIGSYGFGAAFSGCTNLKEASFGMSNAGLQYPSTTSARYILSKAFIGCTNLETLRFSRLYSIGSYALASMCLNNNKLSQIVWPLLHTLSYYGLYYAFQSCQGLTRVDFPCLVSVESGGFTRAFYNCNNLSEIHFPINASAALRSNTNLTMFDAPNATMCYDLGGTINIVSGSEFDLMYASPVGIGSYDKICGPATGAVAESDSYWQYCNITGSNTYYRNPTPGVWVVSSETGDLLHLHDTRHYHIVGITITENGMNVAMVKNKNSEDLQYTIYDRWTDIVEFENYYPSDLQTRIHVTADDGDVPADFKLVIPDFIPGLIGGPYQIGPAGGAEYVINTQWRLYPYDIIATADGYDDVVVTLAPGDINIEMRRE